tara:strand:+ start:1503 stop:1706 length:204 start_codon:yes stop_codon:yes gene_type:complete
MESQKDLNESIRVITLKIQEEHPELVKYISEIPRSLNLKTEKEISSNKLKEYLDSLNMILKTYSKEH